MRDKILSKLFRLTMRLFSALGSERVSIFAVMIRETPGEIVDVDFLNNTNMPDGEAAELGAIIAWRNSPTNERPEGVTLQ